MTFIVRIMSQTGTGVTGIVERVRTGEKHRFSGLESLGPLLAQLMREDPAPDLPPAP